MKPIVFVDFYGVLAYHPYFLAQEVAGMDMHPLLEPLSNFLFVEQRVILDDWMRGKFDTEAVMRSVAEEFKLPFWKVMQTFVEDCQKLTVANEILDEIEKKKSTHTFILRTDNMDSFHRFTLPSHPRLLRSFDAIHNSYHLGKLKLDPGNTYYTDTVKALGSSIEHAVMLDDTTEICDMFRALGGTSHQTVSVDGAVSVIRSL